MEAQVVEYPYRDLCIRLRVRSASCIGSDLLATACHTRAVSLMHEQTKMKSGYNRTRQC